MRNNSSKLWRIVQREIVYQCLPYLSVEKHSIELPDGRRVEDYHRIHIPDTCLICPFTKDGKIIFLRSYKHSVGDIAHYLPGGFIEDGEDPLFAAKRELLEETGYAATTWQSMGAYIPNGSYGCGRVHIFKAKEAGITRKPKYDDLEDMNVELVEQTQALDWINRSQIQSLTSVAAIVLATMKFI